MKKSCHRIVSILLMVLVMGVTGGCTKGMRVRHLLKAANKDFDEGRYDDAEVDYKEVRYLQAGNPTAIGQLGRIYLSEGNLLEAYPYLKEAATKLQPNSLSVQLAYGQLCAAFHDSTNAAAIAMRILSAQPTNDEALILLANTVPSPPQLQQRLQSLPHVEENPAYHVVKALMASRAKKFEEAANEVHAAIAAHPESSDAYFVLAELSAARNDAKGTVQAFKKAAELAPPRSPIRSRYVDYLIQTGSVEEARKIASDMTEKTPDYIPGWVALMDLNLTARKYNDAADDANAILTRDERNFQGLIGLGTISLAKGDAVAAVAQFERLESLYPKSPQAKFELARAYMMSRDRVKAMANLNQTLALDPTYGPGNMLLAQLELRSGDSRAAADLLTRYIKKVPGDGQAELLLADAYLAQQNPNSALAVYHHLEEKLPKNPQIPMLIGIVLAGQHKFSQAEAAFEKSIALAPDYMVAVEQLINLDLVERKFSDAEALVQAQMKRDPKAADAWELQAKIDVAQTNMIQAEKSLLKAIDLNPNLPNPYLLLAQVYVGSKKYEDALKNLQNLVGRTNDAVAYMQIGAIHEELKEFGPARDAYEKVLSINPKSSPALNNLAYIDAVHLHDLDRAYTLALQARDLLPYNPNVGDTLGWILYEKGDYIRALALLEDAADKAPGDAEIQFHVGMAHYTLDEEELARISLQRAISSTQDFPNKDEASKRLALLNIDPDTAGPAQLAELQKLLKERPDDPVILNRIGTLQERQGDAEKAADTYKTALKQNPDVVSIMAKLARLYALRLNQPDQALSMATAAHKLAPDNAQVSGILGHLIYRTGDYIWALSLLESAAEQLPNQPGLLHDLAWAYYSVGRVADAEATMQKITQNQTGPDSQDAKQFVAMVEALKDAAASQGAASQAQNILQKDPNNVPALMVSGAAQERAGDFKGAQQTYERALAALPMFSPAARQLAILDSKYFPDDAEGYALAEKARSAYSDDPAVAKSLGILSYHQGKFGRSAEVLQESIDRNDSDGEIYYFLGMDLLQLKRNTESKHALQRAVSLPIPSALAAEARRALESLK